MSAPFSLPKANHFVVVPAVFVLLAPLLSGAASALVPADHPSVRYVERLEELGLVENYLPGQRAVPLDALTRLFGTPSTDPRAASFAARFAEEFRIHELGPFALTELAPEVAGAVTRSTPRLESVQPPVLDLPASATDVGGDLRVSSTLTRHLAARLVPSFREGRLALSSWEVVGGIDRFSLSVGRAAVAYGFGRAGGIVFSGDEPLNRVELQTTAPIWIPVGGRPGVPIALHAFLSQLREDRHPGNPFLLGTSISAKPHPRLTLSAQRAVLVGTGNRGRELSATDVVISLVGVRNTGENNVLSAAFRYRMPTDEILPITLYGEWGTDDSAGGHYEAPGIVAGLRVPAIPGAPEILAGVEFAYFGVLCCRYRAPNTGWYAHFNHVGGWTSQDRPLGHPLGGDGRELRLYGDADLFEARLRIELDAFLRDREDVNLYSPPLIGNSAGGELDISWRVHPHVDLAVEASYEQGESWSLATGEARLAVFF